MMSLVKLVSMCHFGMSDAMNRAALDLFKPENISVISDCAKFIGYEVDDVIEVMLVDIGVWYHTNLSDEDERGINRKIVDYVSYIPANTIAWYERMLKL